MSDEIKEILDKILLNCDTQEEKNKLLDYITNLQEENQRLKELCDKYEEKKIPEKLNYPHIEIESSADDEIRDYLYKVKGKFDEIIDYLDYLKSKGE